MDAFTEDWNASQFWYDDETATLLAKQLLEGAANETAIAVVSAPSVFIQLKNLLSSDSVSIKPEVVLLEFDKRFSVFKEFVFYDFANPTKLPGTWSLTANETSSDETRSFERPFRSYHV